MTGWKDWQIGEVVTESDFQNLVQDQVVQRYADASARSSTLGTAIAEGMVSYLEDTNSFEVYDGSAWVGLAGGFTVSDTAPTAPSEGDTWYNSTNGNLYTYYDSYWVETSAPAQNISAVAVTAPITNSGTSTNAVIGIDENALVGRNYIINGAFDVWQRGTSNSTTTIAEKLYVADRFYSQSSTTSSFTLTNSQIAFTPAELNAIGFGDAKFYLRYEASGFTDGAAIIRQDIEDVRSLAGQTITISYYAKASTSITGYAAPFVRQYFGSGGSANVDTNFTNHTYTTSWARYTSTITLPSISGKTIGAGSYLQLVITLPNNSDYTFDIWGVQLEAGSVATPFKRHAPSLGLEEEACKRYFTRIEPTGDNDPIANGFANSTTQVFSSISLPVPMRTTPTFSTSATASQFEILRQGTSIIACSSLPALSTASTLSANVLFTVASGLSAGEGVVARQDSGSFLDFSAEL